MEMEDCEKCPIQDACKIINANLKKPPMLRFCPLKFAAESAANEFARSREANL